MSTTTTPPPRTARTQLPSREDLPPAYPRVGVGAPTAEERFVRIGSWAAGFALAWILTQRVLPLGGLPWLIVAGFVCGLLVTAVTTAMTGSRVDVADRLMASIITGGAVVVLLALATTITFTFLEGWRPLVHLNFYYDDMAGVGPRDPLNKGGIGHAILGSLIELGIAIAITLPLGVGTAVFMVEIGGRFARLVRTIVEAMTALPSIVAGLFIYVTIIVGLGIPPSGLAASLAISVMMLPIIARAADVVLRVVPGGLREASLALGASRWKTVWHVVLPTARPGLATALILGVARGVGETSPVLLTSGAASFYVWNPSDGVMNSLPLYIFFAVRSGEPLLIVRGFGAASVLLAVVLILFVTARLLARPRSNRSRSLRRTRVRPDHKSVETP
ncbi:PstA family ABC transporter permease [Nocardioides speluncae]|uniref:PstA family ABC transporter permease n=1 Tax=Nocardioides speluncae TaxID=2670337 RepID=UPI000D69C806|nr:PstA family ABC transporter permease [Nocardioides speluncae]